MMKNYKLRYEPIEGGFEILLYNGNTYNIVTRARRIAFCERESDARDIVEALKNEYRI